MSHLPSAVPLMGVTLTVTGPLAPSVFMRIISKYPLLSLIAYEV